MREELDWNDVRDEAGDIYHALKEGQPAQFSGNLGAMINDFKTRGGKCSLPISGIQVPGIKNHQLTLGSPQSDCVISLRGKKLGSTIILAQSGAMMNTRCSDYPFPIHRPDVVNCRTALRDQHICGTLRTIKDSINGILPHEMCWESDLACHYISRGYFPKGLTNCRYVNFEMDKTNPLQMGELEEIKDFLQRSWQSGERKNFRRRIVFEFNPQAAKALYQSITGKSES